MTVAYVRKDRRIEQSPGFTLPSPKIEKETFTPSHGFYHASSGASLANHYTHSYTLPKISDTKNWWQGLGHRFVVTKICSGCEDLFSDTWTFLRGVDEPDALGDNRSYAKT